MPPNTPSAGLGVKWSQVQILSAEDCQPKVIQCGGLQPSIMHPVDPSNKATSAATAAPAFSIRRLVLFAFIELPFICG